MFNLINLIKARNFDKNYGGILKTFSCILFYCAEEISAIFCFLFS